MRTDPSIPNPTMGQPGVNTLGACVCGVPLVDHYRRRSRGTLERLDCDTAAERHARRVELEAADLQLLQGVLAAIVLRPSGRVSDGPAFAALSETEQREVRQAAAAALSLLDAAKRCVGRQRAYVAGIEAYAEGDVVAPRVRASLRLLLDAAITANDNAVQGVDPITDQELAFARFGVIDASGEVRS